MSRPVAAPEEYPPVDPDALGPGTEVGAWRVVERLGVGGFGAVYRVEDPARPGDFYALKLALRPWDARAEREITLLMSRAVNPHVVRCHATGRWPHPRTGHLYFVMDWVEGRPLHTWAEEVNPSFRELAEVVGKLALAFDALHAAGVLHRDVKPDHLLIRDTDGAPVLIDFGVGDYEGAETLTTAPVPPGTAHLRSPEQVRFHREHHGRPGVRYEFQPTDDLYALGVSLYRVVTGHFPFPPHLPADLLYLTIEGEEPPAPADFNRRVPPGLSALLQRLLAKNPHERPQTGSELHAALVAALATGKPKAWDGSLFEWEAIPEAGLPPGESPRRRIRRPEWPPRRRMPPWRRFIASPPHPRLRPWLAALERGAQLAPGAKPAQRSRQATPSVSRAALGLLGLGLLTAVGLGLHGRGWWVGEGRALVALVYEEPQAAAPLLEVAPAGPPPEAARSTASQLQLPTAPQQEDGSPVKTQPRTSDSAWKSNGVKKAAGLAGMCLGVSCAGPQVRPPPPPEACPPGAVETMKELGIELDEALVFTFDVVKGEPHVIPVKEGTTTLRLVQGWEGLRSGSLLSGQLYFGDRIYGRFTWARSHAGRSYPVCMEILSSNRKRGLEREPEGDAHSVRVWATGYVNPVDHFE